MARRSGLDTLAYMGVEAQRPPTLIIKAQAPNANNNEFNLGTIWIDTDADDVYMLTSLSGGTATWTQIEKTTLTIDADTGSATPAADAFTIAGNGVISTTGATDTITVALDQGTDGQLLVGATSAEAAWANLTSNGGTITVSEGTNTLNIDVVGGVTGATTFVTDSGTATVAGTTINILGGTNLGTVGASDNVTVNLDASPSVAGSITAGTGLVVTTGGIDSTGTTTLQSLSAGVMQTSAAGVVSSDNGTNGQILVGGGSAPAWANITSTGGTITVTEGANTINLEDNSVGLPWTVRAATPTQTVVGNGYISTFSGEGAFVLPATASVGDIVRVTNGNIVGGTSIHISQNASQWITNGSTTTSTGVSGFLNTLGAVELLCTITNVGFRVLSSANVLSYH